MTPRVKTGNIVDERVDVIINAWNRNIIPWWLLLPQGVSGAIKKHGGTAPFRELARMGPIPLGEARITGSGRLPVKNIIHVAGINMFWVATAYSVQQSVRSAMALIHTHGFRRASFPLIGSGSGNRGREWALAKMMEAFAEIASDCEVTIVRFENATPPVSSRLRGD